MDGSVEFFGGSEMVFDGSVLWSRHFHGILNKSMADWTD
jgi:hypothetical protein